MPSSVENAVHWNTGVMYYWISVCAELVCDCQPRI